MLKWFRRGKNKAKTARQRSIRKPSIKPVKQAKQFDAVVQALEKRFKKRNRNSPVIDPVVTALLKRPHPKALPLGVIKQVTVKKTSITQKKPKAGPKKSHRKAPSVVIKQVTEKKTSVKPNAGTKLKMIEAPPGKITIIERPPMPLPLPGKTTAIYLTPKSPGKTTPIKLSPKSPQKGNKIVYAQLYHSNTSNASRKSEKVEGMYEDVYRGNKQWYFHFPHRPEPNYYYGST